MSEMFGNDEMPAPFEEPQFLGEEPQLLGEPAGSSFGEVGEFGGAIPEQSPLLEGGVLASPTDANPFLDNPEPEFNPALDPELFARPEPPPEAPQMFQNPGWMEPGSPLYQEPQPVVERAPTEIDPALRDEGIVVPPNFDPGLTQADDQFLRAQDPPAEPAPNPVGFEFPNAEGNPEATESELDLF